MIKKSTKSNINGIDVPDEYLMENLVGESLKRYNTFSPTESMHDELYDSYYENSTFSDLDEFDLEIDDLNIYASNKLNSNLINFSKENLIVFSSEYMESDVPIIDEDVRYSNMINGARSIFVNNYYKSASDYRAIIDNFVNKSFYKSDLFLKTNNFYNQIENYAKCKNLSVHRIDNDKSNIIKISKDFTNQICSSIIKTNSKEFKFLCDLADTYEKKVIGLQGRDSLYEKQGMLFSYDRPSDVSFHMGNVSFPIDIIFIDDSNVIKKIESNIMPKTAGIYSCANIKSVLEIPGGFCASNNINVGDLVFSSTINNLDKEILKKSYNLSTKFMRKDEVFENILAVNISDYINLNKTVVKGDEYSLKLASYLMQENPIKFVRKKEVPIKVNLDLANFLKNSWHDAIIFYYDENYNKNKLKTFIKKSFLQNNIEKFFDVITISKNNIADINYVSNCINSKFSSTDMSFTNSKIIKRAGFPVSKSTKKISLSADKKCVKLNKILKTILKDIEKNALVFEKLKDKPKVIEKSKGQINQSFKRIKKKYVICLKEVKSIYIEMDKIKDVSSTLEVLNALLLSTKNCSNLLKSLFEMVDKTSTIDFVQEYRKRTDDSSEVINDLKNNVKRLRDYIYSQILGKTILSE